MVLRISGGSCNYYKDRESRTVSKDTKENKGQIFFFSFLHLRRVKLEEEKNQKKGSVKINHVFRKSKGLNSLEGQVS